MRRILSPQLMAACLLVAGGGANANLDGTAAGLRYDYAGSASTTDIWTVGAGPEATCPGLANVCTFLNATGTTQTIDLGGVTIAYLNTGALAAFSAVSPNSFNFIDLKPGFAIGNVTLSTTIPGLDWSRVSYTADSVSVVMGSLNVGSGDGYTLTLSPVPEPSSALLLGVGAALIAAARRRALRA